MQVPYQTGERALCLKITVLTNRPETIILKVSDASVPGALYENRYQKVTGSDSFFVKMPTSPQVSMIHVYNSRNGDLREGMDKSFRFRVEEVPLKHWMIPMRINVPITREAVLLFQQFSQDASFLSTGHMTPYGWCPYSSYESANNRVKIHYFEVLHDWNRTVINKKTGLEEPNMNYGREVTTPMRTDADSGVIEVARRYIINYTVPMIMAILCHEFSHFFVNVNPENEKEADRNALIIFLSLGYSKIAALKAFLEVFKNADSKLNRERDREITDFVNNFDRIKFSFV